MQTFNYWLIGVSEDEPYEGYTGRYSSYSQAMALARQLKSQHPDWRVAVELLPSWQDHPDVGASTPDGSVEL